jgi:hypothetical protein
MAVSYAGGGSLTKVARTSSGRVANHEASEEKRIQGILGDFSYYNFNDFKTSSLEVIRPIHAKLPLAFHFHFHPDLCYFHMRCNLFSKILEVTFLILDSFTLSRIFFF